MKKTRMFHLAARLFSLLIALTLVAASLPQGASAAPIAQTCARNHSVVSGETLSAIAVKYSVDWLTIAQANKLADPYILSVGQTLCIPGTATTSTSSSSSASSTTSKTDKKNSVTFSVDGNFITVKADNFAKKVVLIVRVDDARKTGLTWYRLGMIRTKNNTGDSVTFRLPKNLLETKSFRVCLKNARTDVVYCKLGSG
jgi:LysM repeat protein